MVRFVRVKVVNDDDDVDDGDANEKGIRINLRVKREHAAHMQSFSPTKPRGLGACATEMRRNHTAHETHINVE